MNLFAEARTNKDKIGMGLSEQTLRFVRDLRK